MKTIIGTHSGTFHADDVFAVATLSLLHPDYEIRRSRDEKVLNACDYQIDVGGVYDHEKKIYDHHFRNGPAYDDGLKQSSIGLVWKHYGAEICGDQAVAERVCKTLIRGLDANDNGVTLTQRLEDAPDAKEMSLSAVIGMMNPPDLEGVDEVFAGEVKRARQILLAAIGKAKHWFGCKEEVEVALAKAMSQSKQYMELDGGCKWPEHLRNGLGGEKILYVVYPAGDQWYIRTVPAEPGSFANRKDLPGNWAGLRDEEFSQEVGISDGVFCHHGVFICAAQSRESIIKLVEIAVAR